MAVKRKKRTAKKRHAKSNPKKRKRAKKRNPAAVANPKKRRTKKRRASGTRVRRAHAKNPGRKKRTHKKRRAHKRNPIAVANPRKGRRKGKRRHRRNPGVPTWAMAGLAALAGLAAYALTNAGTFAATQRLDPSLATLQRNRYIAGALVTAGGVALALVSPLLGAGLAAGGLASLFGTQAALAVGKVIDKQPETKKIAGVFPAQMGGVFNAPQLGPGRMQGVYGQQLGDYAAAGYG